MSFSIVHRIIAVRPVVVTFVCMSMYVCSCGCMEACVHVVSVVFVGISDATGDQERLQRREELNSFLMMTPEEKNVKEGDYTVQVRGWQGHIELVIEQLRQHIL